MSTKHVMLGFSLVIALLLSLAMGLQSVIQLSACASDSCETVHASPFARVFGIPLGLWSALALVPVIILHLMKKETAVFCLIATMLGAEIYLIFVQIYFIHALCMLCLSFLGFLFLSFVLALRVSALPRTSVIVLCSFLCCHFFLFFPDFQLRATLAQVPKTNRVEVFASPSCSHCREAIGQLETICSDRNTDLVLRPVPLSPADYEPTLDWICSLFFSEETQSAKKLSLTIASQNQVRLKELFVDQYPDILPVVVVTTPDKVNLFTGWEPGFGKSLAQMLGVESPILELNNLGSLSFPQTTNMTGAGCVAK